MQILLANTIIHITSRVGVESILEHLSTPYPPGCLDFPKIGLCPLGHQLVRESRWEKAPCFPQDQFQRWTTWNIAAHLEREPQDTKEGPKLIQMPLRVTAAFIKKLFESYPFFHYLWNSVELYFLPEASSHLLGEHDFKEIRQKCVWMWSSYFLQLSCDMIISLFAELGLWALRGLKYREAELASKGGQNHRARNWAQPTPRRRGQLSTCLGKSKS